MISRNMSVRLTPFGAALAILASASAVAAQNAPAQAPATRAEVIAAQRADKVAMLWPERQSALVNTVNGIVDRGLREGIESGQGKNGLQVVLGGMRSGQGMSAGLGYRRSDLWRERLSARVTGRGTAQGAYLFDLDVDFKGLRTERTFVRWYSKIERSPHIDYYGRGNDSLESNRATFGYRDVISDLDAGLRPFRSLSLGVTGGYLGAHATSGGGDAPSVEEQFKGTEVSPSEENTQYLQMGVFANVDTRDSPKGPRRGSYLGVRYREYWDIDAKAYAFRAVEVDLQKYLPYFNETRVVALKASAVLTFPKSANQMPIYLQPSVGGNDDLRGYSRYRFRDNNALSLAAEHRWHVFSVLDMAVFADAARVAARREDLNLNGLHYSGGLGFRVRLQHAVITRIDLARSSEGFRVMWTFSDIFGVRSW
jgi:hypothetical protein